MKIAVIGTGYVGLVTGTCFAEKGNEVRCIDKNEQKIAMLRRGEMPIYEDNLEDLVTKNVRAGRMVFTGQLEEGVKGADLVFIAVGTPQSASGAADLSGVWAVGDSL